MRGKRGWRDEGKERLSYWIRDDTGNGVRGWGKGKGCGEGVVSDA